MRIRMLHFALGFFLFLAAGPSIAGGNACGMPEISGSIALQRFLGLRAVEFVRRAARSDSDAAKLMLPSATFDLGAGDVGRPLGTGMDGAASLVRAMSADTYRFQVGSYMDMPVDPCARQTVEVEFIDSKEKTVSRMTFTFEGGRLVKADGWLTSFETGRL